ncbi:MAG TPA: flippase-like domain-containing protein [Crocinitomicaceae bacterium]|nr:flippase-like domain-containing protein [Crocinitomicaceae bacterium]
MKNHLIKILKIIVPIGIGVYLTWYFFNGLTDHQLDQTKNAFFDANYFWVFLGLFTAVLSHLSRAYRWLFLLEPLGYRPKLSNSFHSVMAGYVINFTVPRSGEFARAGLIATYEDVPFEKGFATIVVERLIDVIMLGIVFFITGVLQTQTDKFQEITKNGTGQESSNLIWYILGGGFIFGIIGLVIYFKSKKINAFVNDKIRGFWEGLKSIWTMQKKWAFIFHTIFIWTCYVGSIWMFAQAFPETSMMEAGCVFGAFFVGATAIALLPGGIGIYPLWITQVLLIYNIDFAAFGIFLWVAQTVLIVVLGLISLFLIQRRRSVSNNE